MARKHISQMTEDERKYLIRKIGKLHINSTSNHGLQRMCDRDITEDDIDSTLKDYRIIEYKMDTFGEQTALVQSNKRIRGNYINVVVELNKSKVVTCFKNTVKDIDSDMGIYNEKLDIRNLMKSDTKLRTGYFRKSSWGAKYV